MNVRQIEEIELNPETAYLTGFIIGDGSLANSCKSRTDPSKDYRISVDISDIDHLFKIAELIKTIISTSSSPKARQQAGNRVPRSYLFIRNKSLFMFLHKEMKIPIGNKSSIVHVPSKVVESSFEVKKHFLAGYFDADGGFRGGSLGFTTASERMQNDVSSLLNEFKILHSTEKWVNKRYDKVFYGIKLRRCEIDKFINSFPLRNASKLNRIIQRFKCGDAGAVKRDRWSRISPSLGHS